MFSAADWKTLLQQLMTPKHHPLFLMHATDATDATMWTLGDDSKKHKQSKGDKPSGDKKAGKQAVKEEREIQREQQKKWDELNQGSFPASDPVARY